MPAFKRWIVEQARRPGISLAGLAMRNQVNANQLRRWVMLQGRRATAAPSQPMLPVMVAAEPRSMPAQRLQPPAPIELVFADLTVRVHAGADAAALRLVLDALRTSR